MNDFEMTSSCTPFGLLACQIVKQAIADYRALLRGEKSVGAQTSLDEIRRFLLGPWCDTLLGFTDVTGEWVLEMLEKEAENIGQRTRYITIDGRTARLCTWCTEFGLNPGYYYTVYRTHGRRRVEELLAKVKRERSL